MTPLANIQAAENDLIKKYSQRSDTRAFIQTSNTLIPFFTLFYFSLETLALSLWIPLGLILLASLFIIRIFMLMHDCGHKSLFRTQWLNQVFGFIYGVLCGMPQYVWARHHNFHHTTNGNWNRYRGPLSTLSTHEYANLGPGGQKRYRITRRIYFALPGAFMYFIFNPRFNWALGTIKFTIAIVRAKLRHPRIPLAEITRDTESNYWGTRKEYWHMCGNNLSLISIWIVLSLIYGVAEFFIVYLSTVTLAGAAGIIIFTIQHNFPDSYASDDKRWNYHQAAISGTSFLTLPKIINWFGADIAYHHIHHISSRIPNYRLASAHKEYAHLFNDVTRIRLRDIPRAFQYILWDTDQQKIISVKDYNRNQIPSQA